MFIARKTEMAQNFYLLTKRPYALIRIQVIVLHQLLERWLFECLQCINKTGPVQSDINYWVSYQFYDCRQLKIKLIKIYKLKFPHHHQPILVHSRLIFTSSHPAVIKLRTSTPLIVLLPERWNKNNLFYRVDQTLNVSVAFVVGRCKTTTSA